MTMGLRGSKDRSDRCSLTKTFQIWILEFRKVTNKTFYLDSDWSVEGLSHPDSLFGWKAVTPSALSTKCELRAVVIHVNNFDPPPAKMKKKRSTKDVNGS